MDASSLSNITQEEFEAFVSLAILALPPPTSLTSSPALPSLPHHSNPSLTVSTLPSTPIEDPSESTSPILLHPAIPMPIQGGGGEAGGEQQPGHQGNFWNNAERIVSKPLGAIGRIFDSLDQTLSGPAPLPSSLTTSNHQVMSVESAYERINGSSNLNMNYVGPQGHYPAMSARRNGEGGRGSGGGGIEGEGSIDQVTRRIDKEYEDQRKASLEVSLFFSLSFHDDDDVDDVEIRLWKVCSQRLSWK